MSRLETAFLATISLAAWSSYGQTPDVLGANVLGANPNREDLERLLASSPREVAWSAYAIARDNRSEMVPSLAALIGSYHIGSIPGGSIPESGSMPPEAAAIEAVADALIRLQATLPADTIMRLYPQFPAQTIILLSRASDNTAALLQIFQTTRWRDLWLAAGNLLALHPPPEFVRSLLSGVVATFSFRVVAPSDQIGYADGGSGCAGDFGMNHDPAFADWPKARMYRLDTNGRSRNIFAPGIHPVGFSTWETTDYRDSWGDGDCSPARSSDWRTGLLAQLQGKKMNEFPLKPETSETIRYSSAALFENSVQATIEKQTSAFREVVASFVQSGLLSFGDESALQLKCRVEVQDARPGPREALPPVDGKWCTPAPPKAEGVGPPE